MRTCSFYFHILFCHVWFVSLGVQHFLMMKWRGGVNLGGRQGRVELEKKVGWGTHQDILYKRKKYFNKNIINLLRWMAVIEQLDMAFNKSCQHIFIKIKIVCSKHFQDLCSLSCRMISNRSLLTTIVA